MNAWLRLAIILCEVYSAMALFLAVFILAVKTPIEDEETSFPAPKRYVRRWSVYLG